MNSKIFTYLALCGLLLIAAAGFFWRSSLNQEITPVLADTIGIDSGVDVEQAYQVSSGGNIPKGQDSIPKQDPATVPKMIDLDRSYSERSRLIAQADFSDLNQVEIEKVIEYLTDPEVSNRSTTELALMSFVHQRWVDDPLRARNAADVIIEVIGNDDHPSLWREYVLQYSDRILFWHQEAPWIEEVKPRLRNAIHLALAEKESGVAGTALMVLYRMQRDVPSVAYIDLGGISRISKKFISDDEACLATRISALQLHNAIGMGELSSVIVESVSKQHPIVEKILRVKLNEIK